ncbi:hypothetical protein BUE80_DR009778 [Diplocarpon rosae]|nr:hypothetical protein BUE80_DR009778 [Diplocarpon rosae]
MGIPGIYEEIGRGERISLSKLAVDKFEETGRPLRIAIDVSIWQFQIQSGQGGSSPAIRTLYYRLVRLLSLAVQPLFVFDGPKKPKLKRNKKVSHTGASGADKSTKKLLKLFGFPYHNAPGEAEAECALLQRHGIVDAVLSEDVDTLMFGSGITLRDWSAEGSRGSGPPTHVSLFNATKTKEGKSGLDREGMILVALLSGGDYDTEGLPRFGIKAACEAARAGFGKSLCKLSKSDEDGLARWRADLTCEIQTNKSKFFRTKRSLTIPDTFPSKDILSLYTHPVVSSESKVTGLREDIIWDGNVDVPGLREYVQDEFDWTNIGGARKFIRNLAPALLVRQLLRRANQRDSGYEDLVLTQMNEMEYVRSICGRRTHESADGMPELRVVFHPMDIVKLDLDNESDDSADYDRNGLAPANDDGQIEAYVSDEEVVAVPGKRTQSQYDPTKPDRTWIPETILKVGLPLKVEDYEAAERVKKMPKVKAPKAVAKKRVTKSGMSSGAMDKYIRPSRTRDELEDAMVPKTPSKIGAASQPMLPPVYLAPALEIHSASQSDSAVAATKVRPPASPAHCSTDALPSRGPSKPRAKSKATASIKPKPKPKANPWSISSKTTTSSQANPTITKSLSTQLSKSTRSSQRAIIIDSSPLAPPPGPVPSSSNSRKHLHSPPPPRHSPTLDLPDSVTISRGSKSRSRSDRTSTPSKAQSRSLSRLSPYKKVSPNKNSASRFHTSCDHEDTERPSPEAVARRLSFSCLLSGEDDGGERLSTGSRSEVEGADEFPRINDLLSPGPSSLRIINKSSSFESKNPATSTKKNEQVVISLDSSPQSHTEQPAGREDKSERKSNSNSNSTSNSTSKENPKNRKKFIMLRESLPGTWQEFDEPDLQADRAHGKRRAGYRMSEVEYEYEYKHEHKHKHDHDHDHARK